MMNRAALASLTTALLSLAATSAFADDDQAPGAVAPVTTTTAGTLVVVTPNAPIVVTNGQVVGTAATAPISVTAAIAPPGAAEMPPTPPAAPQNENWNNVSHINGTVVPVGERNQYLYAYRKNNLQSNPIAWMFGYYQIAGSHALSENIAASLEVSGWSTDHGNESGYQIAPTLQLYFKRTFSGPFLEGGLVIHHDDNNGYAYDCYDCSSTSTSSDWVGPEVMFGWSWMFDSGLNMSAAFGAAKRMDSQSSGYSSDDPVPVGYFRVGYAF
ncbi:MAG: hypothetical protein ABJE66_07885 [Deltaproteobacteria bacterium]